MRNNAICFILIFCAFRLSAQMTLIQSPLATVDVKPTDLFKASLQNGGVETEQVTITGTIRELSSGSILVTAQSNVISVAPGITVLSEQLLSPVYTISSSGISQGNFIPFGSYEFCLYVRKIDGIEEITSSCVSSDIQPLSPPILLTPENESNIDNRYPLLSWLPVMPVRKGVLYDLVLTEVLTNQTPYDAIQRNQPLLNLNNVARTSVAYPATAVPIEESKKYAWKVIAKTDQNFLLGESEIWWFTYKLDDQSLDSLSNDSLFAILKTIEEEIPETGLINGRLMFQYQERYGEGVLEYKILDEKNREVSLDMIQLPIFQYKPGKNYFTLNLENCTEIKSGKLYRFQVRGSNNVIQQIHFIKQ